MAADRSCRRVMVKADPPVIQPKKSRSILLTVSGAEQKISATTSRTLNSSDTRSGNLHLNEAQSLEVETIMGLVFGEDGFHDASGHHDLTRLQSDAA